VGDDWRGAFGSLEPAVRVVYLLRTPDVCSLGRAGQLPDVERPTEQTA
jgi:hypothetical protein